MGLTASFCESPASGTSINNHQYLLEVVWLSTWHMLGTRKAPKAGGSSDNDGCFMKFFHILTEFSLNDLMTLVMDYAGSGVCLVRFHIIVTNTQTKQLKGENIYFGSQFQRFLKFLGGEGVVDRAAYSRKKENAS
jgi:hypothetical protein